MLYEVITLVQDYVAGHIDKHWIESLTAVSARSRLLSPPAFRYQLTELARKAGKRIVLPEGDEPRTTASIGRGLSFLTTIERPRTCAFSPASVTVITSYSIHYTKLYDKAAARRRR